MEITLNEEFCIFCKRNKINYTCPRCNQSFCSVPCYRSKEHLNCSESFYHKCIAEEMDLNRGGDLSQQKILQALKNQLDAEYDDATLPDSDDDLDNSSLAERMEGVDLNNSREVWKRLKHDERQEFKALLRSDDISKLVTKWEPWWSHSSKIHELGSNSDHKGCPEIAEFPSLFLSNMVKPPADCVKYNLINILSAYTCVTRYYNGCHFEFVDEAVNYLILLSSCLKDKFNFEDSDIPVQSVYENYIKIFDDTSEFQSVENLKKDVECIMRGPNIGDKNHYILCALSDLKRLFKEFYKCKLYKYNNHSYMQREKIQPYIKKIEYYLAYSAYYIK